ncbi:hypothetical protein GF389_05195 [Candidatus Dojkabacteria bacterium]|nr:hypothetical protein [Candidatus Dojkabacteria bacterium]
MYPVLFEINSVQVYALPVFMALGLFVFGVNLWRETKEDKNFAFDLFVINLIVNPLVAKIMHIVLNLSEYASIGWRLLPIKDTGEGVELFTTFPWVLVAFWEGGMDFRFVPLALLFSIVVLLQFRRERILDLPMSKIWRSFIFGLLVIVFGLFLDGAYLAREVEFPLALRYKGQSQDLVPVHLIEIVALLLILILYIDALKVSNQKLLNKLRIWLFPLYWAIVQVGLWFIMSDHSKDLAVFNIAQVVWMGFILVLMMFLLPGAGSIFARWGRGDSHKKTRELKSSRKTDSLSHDADYSYSFSKYKKGMKSKMTPREKLKQTKNRIRRSL